MRILPNLPANLMAIISTQLDSYLILKDMKLLRNSNHLIHYLSTFTMQYHLIFNQDLLMIKQIPLQDKQMH